jgi:hypothetical protein
VGEETTEFASRFSSAVTFLREVAGQGARARVPAGRGADLASAVRHALEAVEAVYATETGAVRDWPEQRRRAIAQLAAVRAALEGHGVGEELRREVGTLVLLIDPGTPDAGGGGGRRLAR